MYLRRDSVSLIQENLKDLWDSDVTVRKSKENGSFGIVWRITNFTMCKVQKGEYFDSPIFVAECLQNTNWYLRLYPRGQMDCDDIACYLFRGNSSPDSITVRYKLSVGALNECVGRVQTFEKYSHSAVAAYARRDEVLNEVRKYPLVDILLVNCRIWKYQAKQSEESSSDVESMISYVHNRECSADHFPPEVLRATMDEMETLKQKIRPYPDSCSIYTRIPVERWYFLWSIKRFSEIQPHEKEIITIVSVSESAPKILMTFSVNEKGDLEMEIRELTGKFKPTFTINCKVQLVGIHERKVEIYQGMHLFSFGEIWKIPLNATQAAIVLREDRFLLDDELTFRCELAVSHENEVSNIDSCSYIPDDSKSNNKRHIPYNTSTILLKYLNLIWRYIKFFSIICVLSFFITSACDTLSIF